MSFGAAVAPALEKSASASITARTETFAAPQPAQARVPVPLEEDEAPAPPMPLTAPEPEKLSEPKRLASIESVGITDAQVAEIKAGIQSQQKFIAELIEHVSRWEVEGGELRLYFPPDKSAFAGLIEGRDTIEKIRGVSGKVLGRAVRVCAKLDSGAGKDASSSRGAQSTQEIRAQFENDPMVRSMLQRFGGRISEVRRQGEE